MLMGRKTLLDIVFDAICELAGKDGCGRVLVRQIQAQTSLRLGTRGGILPVCCGCPQMLVCHAQIEKVNHI